MRIRIFGAIVVAALLSTHMSSCSSFDLGAEKPVSFAVNTSAPTWDTDILPVVKAKCANCHTPTKGKFVPKDVPTTNSTLDDITTKDSFASLASSIKTRVFDTPTDPMPPHFATQLTDNEKAALSVYIESLSGAVPAGCTATTTTLAYADVSAIIDSNCSVCHTSGGTSPALNSLALVKTSRIRMIDRIHKKTMPPSSSGFDTVFHASADRTKLLEWLCVGSDAK